MAQSLKATKTKFIGSHARYKGAATSSIFEMQS